MQGFNVLIKDLIPDSHNANRGTPRGLGMLEKSLQKYGAGRSILIDKNNRIIAGNKTAEVAGVVGLENVRVVESSGNEIIAVKRTDLDLEKDKAARELAFADNRTSEVSIEWSPEEITSAQESGCDLSDMFTQEEISMITGVELGSGLCDPDDTPEPPADPKSKPGDLWTLGNHRLFCGDSTNPQHVEKLLGGAKPFIMVTDPPYGVEYDPNWRNVAAEEGHLSYGARAIGKVENDSIADWSAAWLLSPCDVVYTWSPPGDHVLITGKALVDSGFEIRSMIIWKKSHFAISRGAYHYQHEPCWYAVRKGKKALWCGDRSQSTVWEINHIKNETGHGTQKPVECMARPIRNHGGKEEYVYDPFLGSGTTMIACEQLGRRCFGLEISPSYCDVILNRFQKFTGIDPVREDGAKWSEINVRSN
jgi:DNA modification methylase